MKEVIKTAANPRGYTVEVNYNGNVLLYDNKSFSVIPFKDRFEMWELLDQLAEIIPPAQISTEDKYIGEPGKYDVR